MISRAANAGERRSPASLDRVRNGHAAESIAGAHGSELPPMPDHAATASLQPGGWPRRRWLITALLVFIFQVGLIVALSDRAPLKRPGKSLAPLVRLAGSGWAELLALEDPTLFALPHSVGFSGPAWMKTPALPVGAFSWSEKERPLELDARELGAAFHHFVATNDFNRFQTLTPPEAVLLLPKSSSSMAPSSSSSFRIEGQLAQRRLGAPPRLRAWASTELLTNTVIQLAVDAEGRPASPGTLLSTCGYSAADQYALEQARAMRFNSIGDNGSAAPLGRLTWGKLIFEWRTVPLPATNSPPTAPGTSQ